MSANLPFRHLSIRVPWQDSHWKGTICKKPLSNNACLCLRGIGETRDDSWESEYAGTHIADLGERIPPCLRERAGFMSPRSLTIQISHKLGHDEDYKHIRPTPLAMPAFSAPGVPFNWLTRADAAAREERLGMGYDTEREPMDRWKESGNWVLDPENQKTCLESFWSAIMPGRSLVFFYAKAIPGIEDNRRILLGAARVTELKPLREYIKGDPAGYGAWVWERPVVHSLRPEFHDGFLMPYHELIHRIEAGEPLYLPDYVAFAADERRGEFSYATEHVTADGALGALEEMRRCLILSADVASGPWDRIQSWINDRIIEVRNQRGAHPGLGAALTAMGLPLGEIVAAALTAEMRDDEDPWQRVESCFDDPGKLPETLRSQITSARMKKWKRLPKARKDLLRLISRFVLTADQASLIWHENHRQATGIRASETEILENPFLISEQWLQPTVKADRRENEDGDSEDSHTVVTPPSVWTIDRGVYLPSSLSTHHPLPGPEPEWEPDDARRIRALIAHALRSSEREGHTSLPMPLLLERIQSLAIEPSAYIDADLLDALRQDWEAEAEEMEIEPEIVFHPLNNGSFMVQTSARETVTRSIRNLTRRVRKLSRLPVTADWAAHLNEHLPQSEGTSRETKAREEKAAALAEIAESRFSVLVGTAGTGKTSILKALLNETSIRERGVLLLAPTGKARVRMQTQTNHQAQTLGQFLIRLDRYQPISGTYFANPDAEGASQYKTVIVDEASMLTEDQLSALLDAVKAADRVILVGDPGQLPPIGAGRPFADLVHALGPAEPCWPRVTRGYAELTQRMRQGNQDEVELLDIQLAEFFSGRIADAEILHHLAANPIGERFRCVSWDDAEDFRVKFRKVLADEFDLPDTDLENLCGSLGASRGKSGWYFNRGVEGHLENWQVISPMNLAAGGTEELNRIFHSEMRGRTVDYANGRQTLKFRIPKPLGPQQLVYGSKVMNTENRPHEYVSPRQKPDGSRPLKYLSNGEIGVITGLCLREDDTVPPSPWFPSKVEVCFSSQPGFAYSFLSSGFGDDGEPPLQLAYAITVHKSQGSEFKKTFVVIPKSAATLSRELLYTALTRHKEKVILLHQGELGNLAQWASSSASETARRFTTVNLDEPDEARRPEPVKAKHPASGREGWYERYLIHRSRSGTLVSSKAEVVVANELDFAREKKWLDFRYEERLLADDGSSRLPDFTVRDDLGRTFYWEHCGMPDDEGYAQRWKEKLEWYERQGIRLWNPEKSPDGQLIVTEDHGGRLDSSKVKEIIKLIFKP